MKLKYLIPFIALVIIAVSCKTTEIVQYEYSSTTMLGTRKVTVTKDSVIMSYNGRAESNMNTRATTDEEWTKLKESVEGVKLNDLSKLEAPTNKRQTDASPYAMFKLSTKDSTYISPSFDGYEANEKLLPLMGVVQDIVRTSMGR